MTGEARDPGGGPGGGPGERNARPGVRRATAGDVDALVGLRAQMFADMGVGDTGGPWRTQAAAWFSRALDDAAYAVVVAEDDGVVVACAMGAIREAAPSPGVPEGRDILVSNVCTLPYARGRGHGRAVFTAVMAWARAQGIGRAELMATPDGRSMYERAGFTRTDFPAMRALL